MLAAGVAGADPTRPPRNIHLSITRAGLPPLQGNVLWYDETGFQFLDTTGLEHHYIWRDGSAAAMFSLYGSFIDHGTGAQWLTLGKLLMRFPNGKPQAELAFDRAVLLDPSLKAEADAGRLAAPAPAAVPAAPPAPVAPPTQAAPAVQLPAAGTTVSAAARAPVETVDEEQRLLGRLAAAQGLPWPPAGTPATLVPDDSTVPGAPGTPVAPGTPTVPGIPASPTTPDAPDVVMVPGSPAPPEQGLFGGPRKPAWPRLTEEQQADEVKRLKSFAQSTTRFKAGALTLHETQYYLFYSDLTPQEAGNWSALLDRMYARLAELFAVPAGEDLWYGKALVFVFSKSPDYQAYERDAEHVDATGSAGMCNAFSNGAVHIAFYRQRTDLDFAHVLVHESVHGFVHRYRSPAQVPSWANEGLAETIASELVPQPTRAARVQVNARLLMGQRGMGDDFFTARHIAAWQYPVAESLCTYMIGQNKAGYVSFINAVKDGMEAEEAIEKAYGAPESRLVSYFFDAMKVKEPL
jgi:hypothetical protein